MGKDNWIERDLDRYKRFLQRTTGNKSNKNSLNYEKFMGFLDAEHFLGLKGKDTWSEEGNESQLMIKNGIAEVLYEMTPKDPKKIPKEYLEFAKNLTTTDLILTFNYDTLLEQTLDKVGIPYRLFPERYSSVGLFSNTTDDSKEELVILKLHGSINWFNRAPYENHLELAQASPAKYTPRHAVFGSDAVVNPVPLCEGPQSNEALKKLFVVKDIGPLISKGFWNWSPMILAPSSAKLFYSKPISEFWWGAQRAGRLNLGFKIIGYSIPEHDDYALQTLYHMARNFMYTKSDLEYYRKTKKGMLRVIDFRKGAKLRNHFKKTFSFLDPKHSKIWFEGFNSKAIKWLFQD